MQFCQAVIFFMLLAGLFVGLYHDFYGKKAREPYGYSGAVVSILITVLLFVLYYHAGAFSKLF